jgi:hypothetical protein
MIQEVYLFVVHAPYDSRDHPVPINATIAHAKTLLHPQVPQPDGGRMYRCLTEFPGRSAGCIVPVSTLTAELDGGLLWPLVADWERVVQAIVRLSRSRSCDAMPLGLPDDMAGSLSSGPDTSSTVGIRSQPQAPPRTIALRSQCATDVPSGICQRAAGPVTPAHRQARRGSADLPVIIVRGGKSGYGSWVQGRNRSLSRTAVTR